MNKEEILEKSRKENLISDERDRNIDYKSYMCGSVLLSITYIFIIGFSYIRSEKSNIASFLFSSFLLGKLISKFVLKRKEFNVKNKIIILLMLLGISILFVSYLYDFIWR